MLAGLDSINSERDDSACNVMLFDDQRVRAVRVEQVEGMAVVARRAFQQRSKDRKRSRRVK